MTTEGFKIFSTDELIAIRKSWGWTQTTMANQLGLSLRAYQDIENGRAPIKQMLVLAVERLSLSHAVLAEKRDHIMDSVKLETELFQRLK